MLQVTFNDNNLIRLFYIVMIFYLIIPKAAVKEKERNSRCRVLYFNKEEYLSSDFRVDEIHMNAP